MGEGVLPKQSQKSRSILKDGSRFLELFLEDKTDIIAEFHKTDVDVLDHSGELKTWSQLFKTNDVVS